MSEEAFRIYEEALKQQHTRNEARRIRTRVKEARDSPHSAGLRWPFELLQNALDAGPRAGMSLTSVSLRCEMSTMVLEHDGAPFASNELAALLSGGSSKEFESEATSGRFGTGFLVTHVLAEQTKLRGLLEVPSGCEQFEILLDRSGDEDAILDNIRSCNKAIRIARPVSSIDHVPSASFEYPIGDDSTLVLGLEALKQALPYIYATRPSLGRVELKSQDGATEVWTPGQVLGQPTEGGYVEQRSLFVQRNGAELPEMRVFRFMTKEGAASSALLLTESAQDNWKVRLPEPQAPRVYREYPLSGSTFLPISFVLDGKFDPDEERSKPLMNDRDKELIVDALAAAVVAVKYASEQKWGNAHLLARAKNPTTVFDPTDTDEQQWWTEELTKFANTLAELPIVECTNETLPAVDQEGCSADFVIPRLQSDSIEDETTVQRMWPLVESAGSLFPPREELASDWTEIANGWHGLGVEVNRVSVKELADSVRDEARTLDQLDVKEDPQKWLAYFLDIVGECWKERTGVDLSVLTGMLPDQNKRLRSPTELGRDAGISELLKDVCTEIGQDVRGRLLLNGLEDASDAAKLTYLSSAIIEAIPKSVSENEIIEEAVKRLDEGLPEDEYCNEESGKLQTGSVRLLALLSEMNHDSGASIAEVEQGKVWSWWRRGRAELSLKRKMAVVVGFQGQSIGRTLPQPPWL